MSSLALKIIAIVTMLIDHIGFIGGMYTPFDAPIIPLFYVMRDIGLISMPLFMFMIAEGCKHTHDINKYFKSLVIFGVISEIPFNLFYGLGFGRYKFVEPHFLDWSHQNVFFTLALGVLAVIIYKKLTTSEKKPLASIPVIARKFLAVIPALAIAYLANVFNTNYEWAAVLGIFLIFVLDNKYLQMLAIVLFAVANEYGNLSNILIRSAAIIPIFFYNGKHGHNINKWGFYWVYPTHLAVMAMIWLLLIGDPVTQLLTN